MSNPYANKLRRLITNYKESRGTQRTGVERVEYQNTIEALEKELDALEAADNKQE